MNTSPAVKLSVVIPVYDDVEEAMQMVAAVYESAGAGDEIEFLLVSLREGPSQLLGNRHFACNVRDLRASNLPAAKNLAVSAANGEFVLFLFPGLFPIGSAIQTMLDCLRSAPALAAVAPSWRNASGKLEIGYNIRRFPTFIALVIDILLLNKLLPRNRFTRRYKMHDFDHATAIYAEHANDCVFLLRRETISRYGGFNEQYTAGWLDQVEFCESVNRAGGRILYNPAAEFVSNENIPLINRLVRDRYPEYRHAEYLYIRNRFGLFAALIARVLVAAGMLQRLGFALILPTAMRAWFLAGLRSYVNDNYVRSLRRDYWTVLKRSIRGAV